MNEYGFSQGIARHASESAFPNLWRGLAGLWVPSAGIQGQSLRDFSNRGNTAAFVNTPTWVGGPRGKALNFVSASSQYLSVPYSSAIGLTGDLTLMARFRTNSAGQQQGLIERYTQSGSGKNGYVLRLTSAGKLLGDTLDATGPSGSAATGATAVTAGRWTHGAFVFTRANNLIYLDGKQDASTANTRVPTAGATPLYLGARGDDHLLTFSGLLDDLRVYARALSAQEIFQCAAGACPLTLARP